MVGFNRSIRLVVADLDGTLLNSQHEITPFTEKMIRAAQAQGVLFTVATGKTFPSTVDVIKQFAIDIPVICGNGTQVFAPDGTLLHEDPIPQDYALEAIDLAQARGFAPIIYTAKGLMRQDPSEVVRFQQELLRVFDGRAQIVNSGLLSLVEVMPCGVTKGTALVHILEHVGLDLEETMCLGDNCNDLDMIRRAGIGVAMGHAPPDVRQYADYVTGTNDEDGVAHAIQRLVLRSQATDTGLPPSMLRGDTS